MEYERSHESQVASPKQDRLQLATCDTRRATHPRIRIATCDLRLATQLVWSVVSPPDAIWKAPYSARFHGGASVPGG